jgi:phage-related protein
VFISKSLKKLNAWTCIPEPLGMPVSRPMPVIANGAHEIRIKDRQGQYRVFYFVKDKESVVVFDFLNKKNQTTTLQEIAVARARLEDML